jgi:hypothetical protein
VNLLEDIIEGATNDSVTTSNLLRKVKVVAHYLKASEVSEWVEFELNGYLDPNVLPIYRGKLRTPVIGQWTGYFGSSAKQMLSAVGLPAEADALFHTNMHQPIAELEGLAALPEDPSHSWDPWQVGQYNQWNAEGKGAWMENMKLLSAHRVVTRASIRGVIDTVRNTALDFALNLHTTDASAGTPNGPTVADMPIASTVNHFTTNVYGQGANLAFGDNARQRSKVVANDVESLLASVRKIGLAENGLAELQAAAESSADERPARLNAVAKRVRSGALMLTTAISAEVAATQVDQLIQQFLGQS